MMDFDRIVYRCRLALRIKYQPGIVAQAEPLFEKEVELIRKLGFENILVEVVAFGDQLHQRTLAFHAIGSGGSSIIFFLLGMSEVDPVRCRTHFQRLWLTASGEPPQLQFVVASPTQNGWLQIPRPFCVSVHPMTGMETIPALLEHELGKVAIARPDFSTFSLLQSGCTTGVFQLESQEVRSLLSQVRISRIKELAMVTALAQIGTSHSEVVDKFLQMSQPRSAQETKPTKKIKRDVESRRPLLCQESIMDLLRQYAGLPWEETYCFVRTAAKGKMTEQHDLWKTVIQRLQRRMGPKCEEFFQQLIAASGWAVCRAHHVANAITSYKAAYFLAHHRENFEDIRQKMTVLG